MEKGGLLDKLSRIRMVVSDIDGVLTDGKVLYSFWDSSNMPSVMYKTICYKDLDAVGQLGALGISFGIITGEKDAFTELVRERFQTEIFFDACKDKQSAIQQICRSRGISKEEICYIGDGWYDLPALEMAGVGVCPADAINEVKKISDIVLERNGGTGCIAEIYSRLCEIRRGNI